MKGCYHSLMAGDKTTFIVLNKNENNTGFNMSTFKGNKITTIIIDSYKELFFTIKKTFEGGKDG